MWAKDWKIRNFPSSTLSIILFFSWYGYNSRILFESLITTNESLDGWPKHNVSTICSGKALLSLCTIAVNRAGLTFRADKSRSIVLIKRRSMNTTPLSVSSPRESSGFTSFTTLSIHSRSVKFLGWIIDGLISDRKSLDKLEKKLLDGPNIIDTSHFTGSQKLWFLLHLLVPHIQWPILIYEVPISLVLKLEQKASVFIQK